MSDAKNLRFMRRFFIIRKNKKRNQRLSLRATAVWLYRPVSFSIILFKEANHMLAENIQALRKSRHITQEKMADLFGVSRQSIQKWESGASVPEVAKLVEIAKAFGISLDALLDEGGAEASGDARFANKIEPSYQALQDWEKYECLLETEYVQCTEEGKDIGHLEGLIREISCLPNGRHKAALADVVFEMLLNAPKRPGYAYYEPSDYADIARVSRHSARIPVKKDNALRGRIKGAWLGRICGCLLGKPIEGIRLDELVPLLKETNNYPMHRYILASELSDRLCERYTFELRDKCYPDTIERAPSDDDTNYLIIAKLLLDRYGRAFTPADVAAVWLDVQSKNAYFTAERIAYRNFMNGYLPPESAQYKNPYREWIGAQIRGDYFGYINPGDPKTAAEMAFRDASISHVKNGIYGEMFAAAMLAKAAVCGDAEEVIRAGLGEIPPDSRLYEQVTRVLESHRAGHSFDETVQTLILSQYDDKIGHHWCHTIPNAMIVTAALLYGSLDYGKTICLAVQSGFDTDCNGATAGSVVGMMIGAARIPAEWTTPVNGKLDTTVFGVETVLIDDMVEATFGHMA